MENLAQELTRRTAASVPDGALTKRRMRAVLDETMIGQNGVAATIERMARSQMILLYEVLAMRLPERSTINLGLAKTKSQIRKTAAEIALLGDEVREKEISRGKMQNLNG